MSIHNRGMNSKGFLFCQLLLCYFSCGASSTTFTTTGAASSLDVNSKLFVQCVIEGSIFKQDPESLVTELLDDVESDFSTPAALFKRDYSSDNDFVHAIFEHITPVLSRAKIPLENIMYRVTAEKNASNCEMTQRHVIDKKELFVGTILKYCSISCSSVDLSFLYPDNSALLAVMGCKKKIEGTEQLRADVFQVVSYMLCPLAYSRWGIFKNVEPLTALLITPTCLYRLTLSKPDIRGHPFGLHLRIEKTTAVRSMGWAVHKYVCSFINDYNLLKAQGLVAPFRVDPRLWTPMNIFAKFELEPFPHPHFGFVYKTTSQVINRIARFYKAQSLKFRTLPLGMTLVVKYLSTLLTVDYSSSLMSISSLLDKENLAKSEARFRAASGKQEQDDVNDSRQKKGSLLSGPLTKTRDGVEGAPQATADSHNDGATTSTALSDSTSEFEEPDPVTPDILSVKHPYLGVLELQEDNPLLVMRYMGETLGVLLERPAFKLEWKQNPLMRRAFHRNVGLSALALVEWAGLCHNDIRPPNIAFQDGEFCLIDFDLARNAILPQSSAFSPDLDRNRAWTWLPKERAMCYSVAQIALNVFLLSGFSCFPMNLVAGATEVWNEFRNPRSPVDAAFQLWADSLVEPAKSFIAKVRRAARAPTDVKRLFPREFRPYFVEVLDSMINSESALDPGESGCIVLASNPRKRSRSKVGSASDGGHSGERRLR